MCDPQERLTFLTFLTFHSNRGVSNVDSCLRLQPDLLKPTKMNIQVFMFLLHFSDNGGPDFRLKLSFYFSNHLGSGGDKNSPFEKTQVCGTATMWAEPQASCSAPF